MTNLAYDERIGKAREVVREYVDRAIVEWRDVGEEEEALFDPRFKWKPGSAKVAFQKRNGKWVSMKMNRPTLLKIAELGCLNRQAADRVFEWAERRAR